MNTSSSIFGTINNMQNMTLHNKSIKRLVVQVQQEFSTQPTVVGDYTTITIDCTIDTIILYCCTTACCTMILLLLFCAVKYYVEPTAYNLQCIPAGTALHNLAAYVDKV